MWKRLNAISAARQRQALWSKSLLCLHCPLTGLLLPFWFRASERVQWFHQWFVIFSFLCLTTSSCFSVLPQAQVLCCPGFFLTLILLQLWVSPYSIVHLVFLLFAFCLSFFNLLHFNLYWGKKKSNLLILPRKLRVFHVFWPGELDTLFLFNIVIGMYYNSAQKIFVCGVGIII